MIDGGETEATGVGVDMSRIDALRQLRAEQLARMGAGRAPAAASVVRANRLARQLGPAGEAEVDQFVAAMIAEPVVAKASMAFWRACTPVLARVSVRRPGTRARLLEIMPEPVDALDVAGGWVALLEATGAADLLVEPATEGGLPVGGPAGWLSRFVAMWGRRRSPQLLALVARMAPRLRADAVAVTADVELGNAIYWSLDVMDLCAELGVPLTPPRADHLSLVEWFADDNRGQRSLRALAEHPEYAQLFQSAASDLLADYRYLGYPMERGRPPAGGRLLDRALQPDGVRRAFQAWLSRISESADRAPLAALDEILRLALPITSSDGYARFPAQLRRLAQASPAAALARTLRTGLGDEYGWNAFDEALQRLNGRVRLDTDWPHLLLHDTARVVLLDPHGVAAEHQLRVPRLDPLVATHSPRCTIHHGRVFVRWWDGDRGREIGYWTDDPDRIRTVGRDGPDLGGTLVAGVLARPPRPTPDTTTAPQATRAATDETIVENQSWHQIDPAWAGSPLGSVDGWVGWQLLAGPDGRYLQGIDGRRVDVRPQMTTWTVPAGAIRFPADPRPRLVSTHPSGTIVIWEPTSTLPSIWYHNHPTLPPLDWWHAMTPRDRTGSARLRSIDNTAADLLLTTAARTNAAHSVETILPEITDSRLRVAVQAQIELASRIGSDLAQLAALAK